MKANLLVKLLIIVALIISCSTNNAPFTSQQSNTPTFSENKNRSTGIDTGGLSSETKLTSLADFNRFNQFLDSLVSDEFVIDKAPDNNGFTTLKFKEGTSDLDIFISTNQSKETLKECEFSSSFAYAISRGDKSALFLVNTKNIDEHNNFTVSLKGLGQDEEIGVQLYQLDSFDLGAQRSGQWLVESGSANKFKVSEGTANIEFKPQENAVTFLRKYRKLTKSEPGDDISFISDLTVFDNERVKSGQVILKQWLVLNSGSLVWRNRKLKNIDTIIPGHSLVPTQSVIDIPTTYPGQVLKLEVELTAPSIPNAYRSNWKMFDESLKKESFEELQGLYAQVVVKSDEATKVDKKVSYLGAFEEGSDILYPIGKLVKTEQEFKLQFKLKNTSDNTLTGLKLVNKDIEDGIDKISKNSGFINVDKSELLLPDMLSGDEVMTDLITFKAPSSPTTGLSSRWKVVDSKGEVLADDIFIQINVESKENPRCVS